MTPNRLRRPATLIAALALALAASAPASAGFPEDWEPLVFELTLTGAVDPEDTFAVAHSCADGAEHPECNFIEPWSYFCSGDEELRADWGYPECAAGTFRIELAREGGITVDYALLRGPGRSTDMERHLADSVTVPEGGITIRLGWDYARAGSPTLPDTAVPLSVMAPDGD